MIDLKEAKIIAQNQFQEYEIAEIIDIGDMWVFGYDSGCPSVPGIPYVKIVKDTGALDFITVPPLENLSLLHTDKIVWSIRCKSET